MHQMLLVIYRAYQVLRYLFPSLVLFLLSIGATILAS